MTLDLVTDCIRAEYHDRMRRLMILAYMGLLVLAAIGCGQTDDHSKRRPSPQLASVEADPWVLVCHDASETTPALMWNGKIGVRLGRDASGEDAQGKALPLFDIGAYETTGEERIITLPNPYAWGMWADGVRLTPAAGSEYLQTLSMKTGMLTTTWAQQVKSAKVKVRHEFVMNPSKRETAERWTVSAPKGVGIDLTLSVASLRNDDAIWRQLAPSVARLSILGEFQEALIKAVGQNGAVKWMPRAGAMSARVDSDGTDMTFERSVELSVPSSSYKIQTARQQASEAEKRAPRILVAPSFDQVRASSETQWAARWKTDVEIDGPVEDQRAVRSFIFYVRSSISGDESMAISPFGLSASTYNGHVFWDADIWVFPALCILDPHAAASIARYRLETGAAAVNNSQPETHELLARKYAWESSVSGKDVAPEEFRKEIHINASVMRGLWIASALGLASSLEVDKIGASCAMYYLRRATQDSKGLWELKDVLSPDEFHVGDNDLYTNLGAEWVCRKYVSGPGNAQNLDAYVNSRPITSPVKSGPIRFKRPRDAQTLLTYDGDALRGYKQAAALLAIYPLQDPEAEQQALKMLERFGPKVTKNGPAMSKSIDALIEARFGSADKAYDVWRESWQSYTDHGLMLFSEKPHKASCYFTTGAGGCLQTVLYGFLGIRFQDGKPSGTPAWSQTLQDGVSLQVSPHLPKAWKRVTLRNWSVRGKRYNVTATHTGTTVMEGDS